MSIEIFFQGDFGLTGKKEREQWCVFSQRALRLEENEDAAWFWGEG